MKDTIIVGASMFDGDGFEIHRAVWPGIGPGYVIAVNGNDMTTFWWWGDEGLIYWYPPLRVGGVSHSAHIHFSFEAATPPPASWHLRRILARMPELTGGGTG